MEEGMITSIPPELEGIPELIHRIQSFLPVKEAAKTSILNKSWKHAWSTIPTLRFHETVRSFSPQANTQFLNMVESTLLRYFRDNIPIHGFDLKINTYDHNHESASLIFKWIRLVATLSCLKHLSLTVHSCTKKFTLPVEILSGENLTTIFLTSSNFSSNCAPSISSNTIIKCVSLRTLELLMIHLSDEVLDKVLSTCTLLEKIELSYCKGFRTIKLKNLHYLCELTVASDNEIEVLEIEGVQHLRSFTYHRSQSTRIPRGFNMDSVASVTKLHLRGVIMDDPLFFNKIESKFHRLESLTIDTDRMPESLDVSCASLKRLVIRDSGNKLRDIRVYAPKLVFFKYEGNTTPRFLFPPMAPEQMEVVLSVKPIHPIDHSFFLKMKESLINLSGKIVVQIHLNILKFEAPQNMDVNELRRKVSFPAMNVQELWFLTYKDEDLGEEFFSFLDALFCICHPEYIFMYVSTYKQLMKKNFKNRYYWADGMNHVDIQSILNGEWEPLSSSTDGLVHCDWSLVRFNGLKPVFKLNRFQMVFAWLNRFLEHWFGSINWN